MASDSRVNIHINSESKIAIVTLSGDIALETVSAALRDLLQKNGFNRKMNSIVDLRDARICADTSILHQISDLYLSNQIERGHGFRMALVCSDDFSFGICRMVAVELEQVPIWAKVVREMEDALIWVSETEQLIYEREIG